jgi:hypothetical protein
MANTKGHGRSRAVGFADRELEFGDHLCALYDTPEERLRVLLAYVTAGLDNGHQVVYGAAREQVEDLDKALREAGKRPDVLAASGQLVYYTGQDLAEITADFNPDVVIDVMKSGVRQAKADGWPLVRFCGEMVNLVLNNPDHFARWVEYEGRLNYEFAGLPVILLCQYDRTKISGDLVASMIMSHPIVAFGDQVADNPYYVPPAHFPRPAASDVV